MRTLVHAWLFLAAAVTAGRAGPAEQAVIAAMKLSERPNYSWRTTVEDNAGSFVFEGKTDRAGNTWLRLPMVPALAHLVAVDSRDGPLEALFCEKEIRLIRTHHGWRAPADALVGKEANTTRRPPPLVRGSASIGGFGPNGAQPSMLATRLATSHTRAAAYNSAHLSVSHPHDELAILVSCATTMDASPEVVTGVLSATGAALLLVRDEQKDVVPLAAAGAFKFWIRNGHVVKYQLRLEGTLAINGRKVPAQVAATTALMDIGRTHVPWPEDARDALARK